MILCELCTLQTTEKNCSRGHNTPTKMRCVDFTPGLERFFANAADYTGKAQITQMASYFGLKGKELKRVQQL